MSLVLNSIHFLSLAVFSISPKCPYYIFLLIMIFSPTIGYLDQLKNIIECKSFAKFNIHTAIIQIFTNYLRFLYWKFKPYKVYLLGQSIAVFCIQIISSFIAFRYYNHHNKASSTLPHSKFISHQLPRQPFNHFFKISQAQSFLEFFFLLISWGAIIIFIYFIIGHFFGIEVSSTIDIVISNIIDTTTSWPLLIQIVWFKETNNVSNVLIAQFLTGDILKLILFIIGKAAWPFIFGASLQLALDFILTTSYAQQKWINGFYN